MHTSFPAPSARGLKPHRSFHKQFSALALVLGALLCGRAGAEDWPTHMHDHARSGVSRETLNFPLTELWSHTPPAEPKRAWMASRKVSRSRMAGSS